jgi:hypothetical protein
MGLGAAGLVAMVLARRHLSRPPSMPDSLDPPPRFIDGEPDLVEENREGAADEDPL